MAFGRPARRGELYEAGNIVTATGEALHGVAFKGKTVSEVLGPLAARRITVPTYRYLHHNNAYALRPSQVPHRWYVHNADGWAPGEVMLWVGPHPESWVPGVEW